MPQRGRYLVDFLEGVSKPGLLFAIWFVVAGFFAWMILSWHRKVSRRNFRGPEDGPGNRVKVDARRLAESTENRNLTVKKGIGVKNSYPKRPR